MPRDIRIYFAGPLFTVGETEFNAAVVQHIRDLGCDVFLPQENEQGLDPRLIFQTDVNGIDWANVVAANMDGSDPDSGTCWEVGYAYKKKPIILYRTDIRQETAPLGPYNLMLHQSANRIIDARHMVPWRLAEVIVSEAELVLNGGPYESAHRAL